MSDWDAPRDKAPVEREVGRHRSRKNTKAWCRGKIGTEHVPAIKLDKGMASWGRAVRPDQKLCRWSMWVVDGFPIDEKLNYHCSHQMVCANCGKIMEYRLRPRECPDFREAPEDFAKLQCKRCSCRLDQHTKGGSACEVHSTCRRFYWEGA